MRNLDILNILFAIVLALITGVVGLWDLIIAGKTFEGLILIVLSKLFINDEVRELK